MPQSPFLNVGIGRVTRFQAALERFKPDQILEDDSFRMRVLEPVGTLVHVLTFCGLFEAQAHNRP